ncbi:GntR family transcriptional regulator [Streptomyces sp. GESEQ-4]|uniref:GntR family transcriptional regulator n=1 Tax=Streptomyces sp. GESEQ-4 TaxID=2812655 RepID=UPI0035A9AA4D
MGHPLELLEAHLIQLLVVRVQADIVHGVPQFSLGKSYPGFAPTGPPSMSRAEEIYQRLRSDILNGRLAPGSRLRVEALKGNYGASSGVLREALPRLAGQGLATFAPQQGFRVVTVSPEHLKELTEARVFIETHVVRESVTIGTIGWESDLLGSFFKRILPRGGTMRG